jgi:hypothetical protein
MRKTLQSFVLAVALLFAAMIMLIVWFEVSLWPYVYYP